MKKYTKKPGSTKKPNGYWKDKDRCVAEARKYPTIREWQTGSPGSLFSAYRHKWMFECTTHMPNKKEEPVIDVEDAQQRKKEFKQRIEAENSVLQFLGMGKKVLFFQDPV